MRNPARWSITWIAVATALLAACGGGGGEPVPPAGFTAAMVQGKTFYRERLTAPDPEKMLITFTSATAVSLWLDQAGVPAEIPGTWSIDSSGRLVLQAALGKITVTLVADEAVYLDVSADDGTGPEATRLYKTIAFGTALLDRFTIADRDYAGASQLMGAGAFASSPSPPPHGGGTMVSTDGLEESSGAWSGNADGSVTLADKPAEETVVYLRADSAVSSPKVLRLVGRVHSTNPPAFRKVADAILTETPAKSGFTAVMVEGEVVYREAGGTRSLIHYVAGGLREEWYEDAGSLGERLDGTWEITPLSGSLRAVPGPGIQQVAAILVEDLPTRWDVLANSGTAILPLSIQKTIPFGTAIQDRFAVADLSLAGVSTTVGVAALGGGTGVFTDGFNEESVTWTAEVDGSITLSSPREENVLYLRADSTTAAPKSLNVVGRRYDAGTTAFTGVMSLVLTETPAKSGFTAGMVEGRAFFRDGTPVSRSVITYLAGGVREEWYEDAVPSAQHRVGTWTLTPLAGSLVAVPDPGNPAIPSAGAMLIEDGPTQWSLLVNNGTDIQLASLEKTVAATASQWFPYTWSVTQRTLAGGTIGPYPITIGDGTGTDGAGRPFTWLAQADGSILVSWTNGDRLTIHQRASSAPPTRFETACVWAPGGTYASLLVQTFAR